MQTATATPAVDLAAVKGKQQAAWAAGDYAVIGTTLQIVGEIAVRSARPARRRSACSTSPPATATPRSPPRGAGATSTATDYVAALLERATGAGQRRRPRDRSSRRPTPRTCRSLTVVRVVLSTFGVMFTPNQDKAASRARARLQARRQDRPGELDARELHRRAVQGDRPVHSAGAGGQIAGAVGHRGRLAELFGRPCRDIHAPSRDFVFRYRSPGHWLEVFRTYYGPMLKAFAALDAGKQASLAEDLLGLAQRINRATEGAHDVPGRYLEVVIRVR